MTKAEDRMKIKVFTMPAEDALQLALDSYDSEPFPQSPKKLTNTRITKLTALDPNQLPKGFDKKRNLISMNLGELLSLSLLAQFFRTHDNLQYDIIVTLEDIWQRDKEAIVSDGSLIVHGRTARQTVQQVMAQDVNNSSLEPGDIESEIIKNIGVKNLRMSRREYPDKSGLLISVYSMQPKIDLHKIIRGIDLTIYPTYYIIFYKLPDLSEAKIYALGGSALPKESILEQGYYMLKRYDNPRTSCEFPNLE